MLQQISRAWWKIPLKKKSSRVNHYLQVHWEDADFNSFQNSKTTLFQCEQMLLNLRTFFSSWELNILSFYSYKSIILCLSNWDSSDSKTLFKNTYSFLVLKDRNTEYFPLGIVSSDGLSGSYAEDCTIWSLYKQNLSKEIIFINAFIIQ